MGTFDPSIQFIIALTIQYPSLVLICATGAEPHHRIARLKLSLVYTSNGL